MEDVRACTDPRLEVCIKVEEMAMRHEMGLDLWSGEPLNGTDADDWLFLMEQQPELPPSLSPEEKGELEGLFMQLSFMNELSR